MGSVKAGGRLLDVLIQGGNKSGSVRPAPHELRDLKRSLEGVPFQLLVPSMSGVPTVGNLLAVLSKLLGMPGMSLSALGLQSILGKLTEALGGGAPQLGLGDFEGALGSGSLLGLALLNYGGAIGTVDGASRGNDFPLGTGF